MTESYDSKIWISRRLNTDQEHGYQPNQGMNLTRYSAHFRCAGIFISPKSTVTGRLSQRYHHEHSYKILDFGQAY